jgi:hypothetical protein
VATDDGAQRRLGHQLGRRVPVADLDHRGDGVDHLEVGDGVDRCGDVVLGDDLLRGHRHRGDLQVDPAQLVDDRHDEEHARTLGPDAAAQPEDHGPLVLLDDLHGVGEEDDEHDHDEDEEAPERFSHGGSLWAAR